MQIEKNVPMPKRTTRAGHSIYPFKDMEVGDSFYCEAPAVQTAAYVYAMRLGRKFSTQKEGDGYRCWRVE